MTAQSPSLDPDKLLAVLNSLPSGEARVAELRQRHWLTLAVPEMLAALADDKSRQDPAQGLHIAHIGLDIAEALGDPVATARVLRSVVQALAFLGRFEEALPLSIRAYELYEAGGQPLEATRTLLGRTHVLASLDRYSEAIAVAERVRDTFERAGERLQAGRAIMNLGNLAQRMDKYSVAEAHYRQSRRIFEMLGEEEWLAHADFNLGNALTQLDRPTEAAEAYERARTYFEAQTQSIMVAMLECNIGFLHLRQCRYTQALRHYQRAREAFAILKLEKDVVQVEMEIADVYLDLNLLNEAAEAYEHAAKTFSELGLQYESGIAWAQLALANVRLRRHHSAEEALHNARRIFEAEANQIWLHTCDLYQAMLCQSQGEFVAAQRLAKRAAQGLNELGLAARRVLAYIISAAVNAELRLHQEAEADLSAASEILSELDLPTLVYHVEHLRGRQRMRQGDLSAAINTLEVAMEAAERARTALPGEALRTAYREDKLGAYQAMVRLLLSSNHETGMARAFEITERTKALALAERIEHTSTSPALTSPEAARLDQLRAELNWYYSAFTDRHPETRRQDRNLLRESIQAREREVAEIFRRRALLTPDPFKRNITAVVTLEEAQSWLTDDDGIIEYFIADDEVLAYFIQKRDVKVYRGLGQAAAIVEAVERLRTQFRKFTFGSEYVRTHLDRLRETANAHLVDLFRILIAPLADALPPRLVIVPHGPLHYIPFHALFDGQHYLIERHQLSYAPSTTLWIHCCGQTVQPLSSALVMAVPDERVPYISWEAEQVKKLYPQALVYVGSDADWETLQQRASSASVLHIASHAMFRDDNPHFSALRLANEWVTVNDLYNLRLPSALVMLTGCETAVNRISPGDELMGLVRALLVAGASTVVGSLWAVHDRTAAELAVAFHGFLQDGLSPAAALRNAQLAVLSDRSHPYYWAPHIVIGRP